MPEYCAVKKNLIVIIIFFSSQFFAQNNWFPMHIGNTWQTLFQYVNETSGVCSFGIKRISIVDTFTINDKTYFTVNDDDDLIWRYDKAEKILYSYFDNSEFVYMDFNLENGDHFLQRPHNSLEPRDVRVTVGNYFIAGETRYCMGVEYRDENTCDQYEIFAENIGPILKGTYCFYYDETWQTYTISANIYTDSVFTHHCANIYPIVRQLSINSIHSSTTLSDTIQIEARGNRTCSSSSGTQYFTFIREAMIEYFYSDGIDTTSTYRKNLMNFSGFNWALYVNLDPEYYCNGYDLFYRFKIIDKDFYPTTYYFPPNSYKKASYSQPVKAEEQNIIKEFSLSQNFPNPFNSSTTFSFSLSRKAYINLEVYNSIGQCVSTLVSEYKPAGIYKIGFDASGLPSGIYFCRLNVMDGDKKLFSDVIKMTFLK